MLLDATTPNDEPDTNNSRDAIEEPQPASSVLNKEPVAPEPKQSDIQEIRKETRSAVLFVDDDVEMGKLVLKQLERAGFRAQTATNSEEAFAALNQHDFEVVVCDVQLGGESGLDLCRWVVENRPNTPVVVITAFGSMETAVGAIRAGAHDFISKPIDAELLAHAVRRAAQHSELHRELARLREGAGGAASLEGLIGQSEPMRELGEVINRVAGSEASVLITGESGTGKELVARAIHARSPRRHGPFVAINCAALPSNLLESELFGHVRGAFTDAKLSRDGLMREANGGTLFLDEVGEMSLEMQVKLLRALQERKVRPVGGTKELDFDTRIVAATNRDIETEVKQGRFREDLYYRINVIRLRPPPLRTRGNDILLLAEHVLRRVADRSGRQVTGFAPAVAARFLEYDWPGNVRELENVVERAVAMARFDKITVEDLPEKIKTFRSDQVVMGGENPEQMLTLDALEERYIRRVLKAVQGNKTQAAKILGLDRRTLYRKLDRYEARDKAAKSAESTQA
ncbi:MAG: sigma-54-dependent Fis family transcriptional regulator [Polyangiaceae bacterium]|nr:sigma-54-dependent Fis family transcriptional regulator [Polyangiaceae bacterium]